MKNSRLALINKLDEKAEALCQEFVNTGLISQKLMETIREIYVSAKAETDKDNERFKVSYHTPITGELEFLIGRIMYYYLFDKAGVKVFVRCQEEKCAPDIRITKNGENKAIIEIKATGGWIRPFLSKERFNKDTEKFMNGEFKTDPKDFIREQKEKLTKYQKTFKLKKEKVFFFIPTLGAVHNKNYKSKLPDYYKYFNEVSGLPKQNLVLLSSELTLGLNNKEVDLKKLSPINNFEKMLSKIQTLCQ